MSNRKGDKWERRYRNALSATDPTDADDREAVDRFNIRDFGFVQNFTCLRIPASGAGVDFDLPDLHVWLRHDGGEVDQFAVEVKAGRERARFKKHGGDGGVPALKRYAEATGATPIAFVHIDYTGDFVIHADELHETSKAHTFTKARDVDNGSVDFRDWVESPTAIGH